MGRAEELRREIRDALAAMEEGGVLDRLAEAVPVSARDQATSATRAARRTVAALGGLTGWNLRTGPATGELRAILAAAATLRVRSLCPHVGPDRLPGTRGETVWISLTGRWAACERCLEAFRARPRADDGRCDLCDEPAPGGVFTEHVIQLGPVMWGMNVGRCCEPSFAAACAGGEP
ncbi:MAG TPA: hypothetical protein VNO79_10925 [Actinomycetota bacterium]|nr:hypothetical protein [Actinomycetota bacterium]